MSYKKVSPSRFLETRLPFFGLCNFSTDANKVTNPRQNKYIVDSVIENSHLFQYTPYQINFVHQRLLSFIKILMMGVREERALRAFSCPCAYRVRKKLTHSKKRAWKFWGSFKCQNLKKLFYKNVFLRLYWNFCSSFLVSWIHGRYVCSLFRHVHVFRFYTKKLVRLKFVSSVVISKSRLILYHETSNYLLIL